MTLLVAGAMAAIGCWAGWTARDWVEAALVRYSELPDFPDSPEQRNALEWSQVPIHQKRQLALAMKKRDEGKDGL